MKNMNLLVGLFVVVILLFIAAYLLQNTTEDTREQYASMGLNAATGSDVLMRRLTECESLPNESTQTVGGASRMFIHIPKDLYPNVNLAINSDGATMSSVSNGERYGYALEDKQKPSCWSYYFEFNGNGKVDLVSKSGTKGIPDYVLHFVISSSTAQ